MQQIEIEMVGAETSQARLASPRDAIARHFTRHFPGLHLGHQEYALALTGNHVTNELLGAAVAVVSRRIDQGHAERNACAQRLFLDSWRMPSLTEVPAALAERRDGGAVWKLYGTRGRLRRRASTRNLCSHLRRKRCTQGGKR